jgi:CheY-like chemotaxis protein
LNISEQYNWKGKKILVVEDDESSAYLLDLILRKTGVEIYHSRDGNEAVEFMKKNPSTDLILMDIRLPEMDGFTATRKIKSFARSVVIIAQTAYAVTINDQIASEAGCAGFITKPVDPAELLEKLSGFLT